MNLFVSNIVGAVNEENSITTNVECCYLDSRIPRNVMRHWSNWKQECIPVVHCIAVAVGRGCLPRGCLPREVYAQRGVYPSMHWPGGVCIPACNGQGSLCPSACWHTLPHPPWTELLIDACEMPSSLTSLWTVTMEVDCNQSCSPIHMFHSTNLDRLSKGFLVHFRNNYKSVFGQQFLNLDFSI